MNTESTRRAASGSLTTRRKMPLVALYVLASAMATADTHATDVPDGRVATVFLGDLDLATPEGQRVAHERLHTMARQVCGERVGSKDVSYQSNFNACVDHTLGQARRQINTDTFHTVTRAEKVPLADLDLSTEQGMRAARDRLQAMARRLCRDLARRGDLVYQPNFDTCVEDTLAGAVRQANAIASSKESRLAERTEP